MAEIIKGSTCSDAWENSITHLVRGGRYVASVRGPVIECLDVVVEVLDPWEEPRVSEWSPKFRGADDFGQSLVSHPSLRNWGGGFDQLEHVVEMLHRDPVSRRAVVSIWDPAEDHKAENAHGVVAFLFTIRTNALHMTSLLRTTDAWMSNWTLSGMPAIQRAVADRLRKFREHSSLALGPYVQIHASYHMYLDDLPQANRMVQARGGESRRRLRAP